MQSGMSLAALQAEIERVEDAKRDYVADTRQLSLVAEAPNEAPRLVVGDVGEFPLTELAEEQIGDRVGIPRKYYQRMRAEAPDLLMANVNGWFSRTPERRMVRTLDGHARAFLSDRFRPRDNSLVAGAALPTLLEQDGISIRSASITERHLYIQAVNARIEGQVGVGDVVQAGVCISNSEVGCGAVRVEPLLFRLVCLNGMITAVAMRKNHVGGRVQFGDNDDAVVEWLATETLEADNRAFFLAVRDVVRGAFDNIKFDEQLSRLRDAAADAVSPLAIEPVVTDVTKRFALTDDERKGVMGEWIRSGDLTRYGLANALTRQAHDAARYERAVEFERAGNGIIELPRSDWRAMLKDAGGN